MIESASGISPDAIDETQATSNEAAGLVSFISRVSGEQNLRIEEDLGEGYVRLRVAEAERRQAKQDIRCIEDALIELLRNSRDAGAKHIYIATTREDAKRRLVVIDDGEGIPLDMQQRVFDARVTSKLTSVHVDTWGVHGRGMALFSIRENALIAHVAASGKGRGASIETVFDTSNTTERSDQSTRPKVELIDGHPQVTSGPHNLIRCATEFALDSSGEVEVFFGSPADIVATLLATYPAALDGNPRNSKVQVTTNNYHSLLYDVQKVCQYPSQAHNASQLKEICADLGLDISLRNAHRVLSGEIKPLNSIFIDIQNALRITPKDTHIPNAGSQKHVDLLRDRRSLKIDKDDLKVFTDDIRQAYKKLAESYYLDPMCEPVISVRSDHIHIDIDVHMQ